MAYTQRYFYTFGSTKKESYRVELWQDGSYTPEEIIGSNPPFNVIYPTVDKFETIRGSGADLTILSETSLEFIDLYQIDKFGIKVLFYSGSTLLWNGYLNSELYSEPFNEKINYDVELTANDGLALLNRLDYYNSLGDNYTDIDSNWDIIKRVLLKLGITWSNIYVGVSTTTSEFTIGASDTILTETYSLNENYYDEDGIAMNCREVLDTILKLFSMYCQIINNDLYILDVNHLANESTNYIKYNSDFVYVSNVVIDTNIGDVSDIGFSSNNQTFEILSPINKQKVSFSTYIDTEIINYNALEDSFSGTPTSTNYGTGLNTWTEKTYRDSEEWTLNNYYLTSSRFGEQIGTNNNLNENDKYLRHNGQSVIETDYDAPRFTWKGKIPKILGLSDYYMRVEVKCYLITTTDLGVVTESDVRTIYLQTELIIGDKKYTSNTKSWVSLATPNSFFNWSFTNAVKGDDGLYTRENLSDTWLDLDDALSHNQVVVPLFGFGDIDVEFKIEGYRLYDDDFNLLPEEFGLKIKDIKFTLLDNSLNEVSDNDLEYISYIDKNIKDDGSDISLKLGSNINNIPTSKGALIANNGSYFFTENFTRNGKTDILENLLLRSINSNYSSFTKQITCDINIINNIFGTLTYSNYLTGNFFISGSKINYSEDEINIILQELFIDSGDINKNY